MHGDLQPGPQKADPKTKIPGKAFSLGDDALEKEEGSRGQKGPDKGLSWTTAMGSWSLLPQGAPNQRDPAAGEGAGELRHPLPPFRTPTLVEGRSPGMSSPATSAGSSSGQRKPLGRHAEAGSWKSGRSWGGGD